MSETSRTTLPTGTEPEDAAIRAYVWAYPLLLACTVRQNLTREMTLPAAERERFAGAPLGRIGHQRALSDPTFRVGVAPNVDTLYSVGWFDLADGPLDLDLPDLGDRYYTVQIGFADTTSVAVGQSTHGGQLPRVRVRAPWHVASEHAVEIVSPHRQVMIAIRMLVEPTEPGGSARVHALQDAVRGRQDSSQAVAHAPLPDVGDVRQADSSRTFVTDLRRILQDWPPADVPADIRSDLAVTGLDDPGRDQEAPWVTAAADRGRQLVQKAVSSLGRHVDGWTTNLRGVDFGDDWLLRAAVAAAQIYIVPATEAIYPVAEVDVQGRRLHGSRRYRLTFGPDSLPPADHFWSLTMYHAEGLLVDNAIDRYAIGDRTPGLVRDAGGGLTLDVSATEPPHGSANWLPCPPGGFRLMLRVYGPRAECRDGSWSPPPVTPVDGA